MDKFTELFTLLESSNKTSAKINALVDYFLSAPERDTLWVIALFLGRRPKRPLTTTLLKNYAIEVAQIPEWLFQESYSAVGDLGETIALILPESSVNDSYSLDYWMRAIIELKDKSEQEKKQFILSAWNSLGPVQRFIFNKLLGGSFRMGISSKMLINALAQYSGQEANHLMHALMGEWDPQTEKLERLLQGEHINPGNSRPYPFCLAYPVDKLTEEAWEEERFLIEYKWDGIRAQIIKRNEEVFIWSRGEELITDQFPEIQSAAQRIQGDFVLDGELLVGDFQQVRDFSDLQKRLNRKNISRTLMEQYPVFCFVYDILEKNGEDLRSQPLHNRRTILKNFMEYQGESRLALSEVIYAESWLHLDKIRNKSREINAEGVMIKSLSAPYESGRKKGVWWKWKTAPLTIDAVLIYAQKGSGRRSGYYTDYTFAVQDQDKLVTIAKAYSGLTDKEIMEVSRFVTKNAIEKFGPVRTVKPELVFELAFEGISLSARHKSGVALRFPRIVRWRRDKTVEQVDNLEDIKQLIQ